MAAAVGKIGEFDSATEDWASYLERLQCYMLANGVEDDKKRDTFLCCVGRETFGLLRALVAPAKLTEKTFQELTAALTAHLTPKPLVIAERFRFHKREQKEEEPIRVYAASLQKLAEHCEFGAGLADTLRDRLVCGMKNEKVQRRLLTMKNLTYATALEEAEMAERAARDAAQFHESGPIVEVHQVPKKTECCYRCEGQHNPQTCWALKEECRYCHKPGHIERTCRKKLRDNRFKKSSHKVKKVEEAALQGGESDGTIEEEGIHVIGAEQWQQHAPVFVTCEVEGKSIKMELDTGAAVSLLPYTLYQRQFNHIPLKMTMARLKTYSGEPLAVHGQINVKVKKGETEVQLPLLVVDGQGPPLMGRNWLSKVPINWYNIKALTVGKAPEMIAQPRIKALLRKFPQLFREELGKMAKITARLTRKEDTSPVFMKARPVPYSLRHKVETELERMVEIGALTPVSWSEWASPIVVVPKPDGSVWICGDFRVTVNPSLKVDQYPLPRVEDILATLQDSTTFSKIDLQSAYLQMELEEGSKEVTTINTQKGLYRFNRLAFGIASAPAIWQRAMDQVLMGIPKTQCLLDDIIVAGSSVEEHLTLLEQVLDRLAQYNLTLNKKKCKFLQPEITYCGFRVDGTGLHKTPEKVRAVVDAPQPDNIPQLRAFLGMVNYYHRFLPNLSHKVAPLHRLLQKGVKWEWTEDCTQAFQDVKLLMASETVLTHFKPALAVTLACDASPYGLGAVLSHVLPDGTEQPIAYASRTLSSAEKNYSQIDKEALAVVWGVKRFHQYLFGLHFTLITDHQPLTTLFNPQRPMSATAASRLQRQALFLSTHSYSIKYRGTTQHSNADALTRLPVSTEEDSHEIEDPEDVDFFMLKQIEYLPVTASHLQQATSYDPRLSKVFMYVQQGWPATIPDELKPYYDRRHELSVEQGCLMWGMRVVIPQKYQSKVLDELHGGHLGTVKMKALGRAHVWWPSIDKDIEQTTQRCSGCQRMKHDPKLTPTHPWEYPEGPWRRVHIDFAGPVEGKMFLVVVDAYSKWPEVMEMSSTTTQATLDKLRSVFARWGIPQQLVSDNGPQFVANEFERFLSLNNVKHIKSSPYHPATNGLAERFVQTLKQALKVSKCEEKSLQHRLANFLLQYRNARHASTETSPALLMIGRDLRSRLHLLKPDLRGTALKASTRQAMARSSAIERVFNPGDKVLVRDYRPGHSRWQSAVIVAALGVKTYEVKCDSGGLWKRHTDQIRANPVGLALEDPPNLRGWTNGADGTLGDLRGGSDGVPLPQPHPVTVPVAFGGGPLPQPHHSATCPEAVPVTVSSESSEGPVLADHPRDLEKVNV